MLDAEILVQRIVLQRGADLLTAHVDDGCSLRDRHAARGGPPLLL
jgi:hypothetical protein